MNPAGRVTLVAWFCVVGALVGRVPVSTAAGPSCPTDVVVLGADQSTAQRADVLSRLSVSPSVAAAALIESLPDERTEAGGLIPAYLLGKVAVSSARLTRRPAGAGLTVTTDSSITFDTAAVYANALLTAGVHDAAVRVTAPADAPALGTTAFLGLLRAASAACFVVPGDRSSLALRELVLTTDVANSYGAGPAAALLQDAKEAAVRSGSTDQATLGAIVDRVSGQHGISLQPGTRATMIDLLHELVVESRRYHDLAVAPVVRVVSSYNVTASQPLPSTPTTLTRPQTAVAMPTPVMQSQTLEGVAVRAANGTLVGIFGGHQQALEQVIGKLSVTRNGHSAQLDDVQRGDRVTVVTDGSGRMVYLTAQSPVPPTPAPRPTATSETAPGIITAGSATSVTYMLTTPHIVRSSPNLVVTRDGRPATLADLAAGDTITVTRAAGGKVVRVDAQSQSTGVLTAVHGTVRAASPDSLTFTASATGRNRTILGPFGHIVTRNHQSGLSVSALRPGDGLTVFLDPQGRVRSVDARGPVSASLSPSPAPAGWLNGDNWALIALLALLLIGPLILLLYALLRLLQGVLGNRRKLPFALMERKPGSDDDAAEPANSELTRDARVLCPDGEIGRLLHVVVVPQSGALLRLIVRDRTGAPREVPARLIESSGPRDVRLAITQPELQALLADQPPYTPRRYVPLSADQARLSRTGVLIAKRTNGLRIEVAQ